MNPWLQLVAGNLFVATLIGGLAWQVGRSGRRAKLAHVLWVTVFVKLITPPIFLLPIHVPETWLPASAASVTDSFPYRGLASTPSDLDPAVDIVHADSVKDHVARQMESSSGWLLPSFDRWTCLGSIWVLGFVVITTRGLVRFIRFHHLLVREGAYDEEGTAFVRRLLHSQEPTVAGSSRCPRVLRLPIRVSPMLFGFGSRPAIVCPDHLWQSLSENDRHAFLAHETAHYHRRDHWVRWLEWIVTAAYWWFPGVYIARRQLERHEEACCDAWAVRQLGAPPRQYAEALLRVVDFISEHGARMPRLASGMQPTESLEERLRLIMQGRQPDTSSSFARVSVGAACMSLWLVHPVPLPTRPLAADVDPPSDNQLETVAKIDFANLGAGQGSQSDEIELPDPPQGFWNDSPLGTWANFSLSLPGARLVAEASRGISIEIPERVPLRFASDELSAIVEIASTNRVVIGDRKGQLRLWDLTAGMPVSLIGRHANSVTSLAHHESCGLVSGDDGGSVMRWDLQSGQILSTWSSTRLTFDVPPSIQSVRFSRDGSLLAILLGSWSDKDPRQEVCFVESRSLIPIRSARLEPGTAVVIDSHGDGWIAVDWSGVVRCIETDATIKTIEKSDVSALVLANTSYRPLTNPSRN